MDMPTTQPVPGGHTHSQCCQSCPGKPWPHTGVTLCQILQPWVWFRPQGPWPLPPLLPHCPAAALAGVERSRLGQALAWHVSALPWSARSVSLTTLPGRRHFCPCCAAWCWGEGLAPGLFSHRQTCWPITNTIPVACCMLHARSLASLVIINFQIISVESQS